MVVVQARTAAGAPVTLQFAPGEVRVTAMSPARQRALRVACSLLIAAFALAAVAVNADVRGLPAVGTGLWIAAGVLAVACALAGGWWLSLVRVDRRRPATTITAADVSSARSDADNGSVTVTVTLGDGGEQAFSALGYQGTLLAGEFGRLLAVHS